MSKFRFSPALLSGILVAVFSAIAFWLRCLPYDKVFSGDWVKFTSSDAYFQLRLVDNLVHNYPHLSNFDPYLIYPGGAGISGTHLFVRIIASISSVFGLVQPTQHTIDMVGVFLPPVLAVLIIICVYFIGKELFGRWVGILAIALLATLPGEFLGRSKLGFTDYHVAEVFFTTAGMLFIILAIKAANGAQLKFNHLVKLDWAVIRKPLIYSLIAGIFLGLYSLTWTGAPLFVFIIFIYFIVQFIIDHLKSRSTDYLPIVGIITFLVTLIISLPGPPSIIIQPALIIAIIALVVLSLISRFMAGKQLKPVYYPVTLLVLGAAGVGLFYLLFPSVMRSMLSTFTILAPAGVQLTTIEMQPLIRSAYGNPFLIVWSNYSTSFFIGFISLGILIYLMVKHGNSEKTLFIVWSLIALIANLGQRRFGYYYSVNVALLTGYVSWLALEMAGLRVLTQARQAAKQVKDTVRRKVRKDKSGSLITVSHITVFLAVIVVFFVVYFWNIEPAISSASRAPYAPSDAWCSSLTWMRENTPEPFEDPEAYYRLENSGKYSSLSNLIASVPEPSEDPAFYRSLERYYPYPDTAYGVLSWWDYGNWITRIARRIPNANPSQDPRAVTSVATFLTAQDEGSANEVIRELDSDYVILDYETAYIDPVSAGGKYWAVITWAGMETGEFFDLYLVPHPTEENVMVLRPFFYPKYYRSMAVRLYNFDGQAVTPASIWVISYEERTDASGTIFKMVVTAEQFDNYEEAEAFRLSQDSDNYRIASMNPLHSCVPLEALEHYGLVHSSEYLVALVDENTIPEVKIFEYLD